MPFWYMLYYLLYTQTSMDLSTLRTFLYTIFIYPWWWLSVFFFFLGVFSPSNLTKEDALFFFLKAIFYKKWKYTLFFIGPRMPGGSCSLLDHVKPPSWDRFMQPLHLFYYITKFKNKWKSVPMQNTRFQKFLPNFVEVYYTLSIYI